MSEKFYLLVPYTCRSPLKSVDVKSLLSFTIRSLSFDYYFVNLLHMNTTSSRIQHKRFVQQRIRANNEEIKVLDCWCIVNGMWICSNYTWPGMRKAYPKYVVMMNRLYSISHKTRLWYNSILLHVSRINTMTHVLFIEPINPLFATFCGSCNMHHTT